MHYKKKKKLMKKQRYADVQLGNKKIFDYKWYRNFTYVRYTTCSSN